MADETKKELPKVGSISFKNGKGSIVINADGDTQEFGLDFVCQHMRRAVKNVKGFYADMIRKLVRDLRSGGMHEISNTRKVLKVLSCDNRQGIRDLCKQWDGWLNYVSMFKNMRSKASEPSSSQRYWDNFDKVFNQKNDQPIEEVA